MTKDQFEVFTKFNSAFFTEHSYLFNPKSEDTAVYLGEYMAYFRNKYTLNCMFSPMPYKIEALKKYQDRIVTTSFFPLNSGAKQIFTLVQHSPLFHTCNYHTIDEENNFIFAPEFLFKDITDCSKFIEENKDFEAPFADKKIGLHAGFAQR